jgi:hypothetical protein
VRTAVREEPALWRAVVPAGLLLLVILLVLARQAGRPFTQVLAAGAALWLIVGLTTWYGEGDDVADVEDDAPEGGAAAPAIAVTLAVPTELRPVADVTPDVSPPAAAAG